MSKDVTTAPLRSELLVKRRKSLISRIILNREIYLMALPGLILLVIFRYLPMYGITVAFKDFNVIKGIIGSPWIGFENYERLMSSSEFKRAFGNTLSISVLRMVFGMPLPIILALSLNEVRNMLYKRSIQTIVYIPHFISWVVVAGIFMDLLSPSTGLINRLIEILGGKPIFFMTNLKWIRTVVVGSEIWKESGWGAIIYLAAITGVDPELYQAASIDGAGRWRQTIHVTLPAIKGTFIVLLIMRLGGLMGANFEQIYMMYNPTVYAKIDVIDTYVFRTTFDTLDFGYTTAAGLFSQVIGCILLLSSNALVKRMGGRGMY
ncbi:MAG: ABC transporter permease subunit [Eubacteriales bacterium]|nr:ABC transporter permease subunit [Clostridiales bacterium]MDD2441412.1 ABC transporter permease subunit [Eubacteriales bacterium]MDD4139947.1 ABC transporter permease subunit [Eubacteriales bacterium]MDD4744011.1 ABC transporter permease subunit [Eubacteriales bacterium]